MKFANTRKWHKAVLSIVLCACVILNPVFIKAQGNSATDTLPSGLKISEAVSKIDGLMKENSANVSGGSFSLSIGGESVYTSDFGYADMENGIEVGEDSVFEWGTASQLLIWVSVLQLAEENKIDMQAEVFQYLPEGELKDALEDSGINMEHLMNYSSGFQESLSEKMLPEGVSFVALDEALINSLPIQVYGAGNVVSVSDWPCALAAYIVECISGVSYAEYVKENIFVPLEMEHTALLPDLSDNEVVMNARGEMQSYQGSTLIPNNFYHIPLYPAGMVTGSAKDFHVFATELLVQDETSRLFDQRETAETLFDTTLFYTNSEDARIAHGMFVYRLSVPVYGIKASSATQTAVVYMEPESKICFTYMSNQYKEAVLSNALAELVFGEYEIDKAEELSGLRVYEGTYVAGNAITEGKLSFQSVLGAMFLTLDEENRLVMPMLNHLPMFEIVDENHIIMNEGTLGNIYSYADGTTKIMMPTQDYVSYSSILYFAQVIVFFAMLAGYFYSSLSLIIALFGFIMRKISKEEQEESKFRKYHYIQCLNVTLFCLIFVFMAMLAMAYMPATSISTASMMFWLGSVMSLVYLIFFYKTGRKEAVSKKAKILYWTTAVFAVITIVFAFLFGLIF